ncbi:hypothetical protein [Delftia phage PhiW-14]|uniref:Uncharacterized protein n=1 Tax=Delftia phage PhiW-14 TaxID=665032 RepID=C9DGH1_BPW14|nr:hypothetical protein DP-phiW-14_gp201 [Delftia phage PhiW-14]ACV50222.1 hypothetical protein [Delftia phage PhiW-14]
MSLQEAMARGLVMIKAIHSWRLTLLGELDGEGYNWKTSYTLNTFLGRFKQGDQKARGSVALASRMHMDGVPLEDYWMYVQLQGPSIFYRVQPNQYDSMKAALKDWMTREVRDIQPSQLEPNKMGSYDLLINAQQEPLEAAMIIEGAVRKFNIDLWDVIPKAVDRDRFPFNAQWAAVQPYRALARELTKRRMLK